ncbi:MAG: SnoaL-like domain-containing protein [Bacteroidota bacterium]
MSNLLEKITDLNDLVLRGKAKEALEKYYDENVVMQESETAPTAGNLVNRPRGIEFFKNITDFRVVKALKVTIRENTTVVEWHYDYTHKGWGIRNYSQVSIQEWKNGKIITT